MAFKFDPLHFFRLLQGLLALITLALYASVASYYNSRSSTFSTGTPAQFAFPIFTSTLVLLVSLPYLILTPRYFPALAHKYAMLSIEAVTSILWFAAWIASAAHLGSLSVCRGNICTNAKVGTVFAAFEWILFTTTAIMAGRYVWASKDGGDGRVGNGFGGNVSVRGLNISKPIGPVSASNEGVRNSEAWHDAGLKKESGNDI